MDPGVTPRILFIYQSSIRCVETAPLRPTRPLIRAIFRHVLGEGLCYP
jgi:hypothetical protein